MNRASGGSCSGVMSHLGAKKLLRAQPSHRPKILDGGQQENSRDIKVPPRRRAGFQVLVVEYPKAFCNIRFFPKQFGRVAPTLPCLKSVENSKGRPVKPVCEVRARPRMAANRAPRALQFSRSLYDASMARYYPSQFAYG